jgi:hypothetical protein
LEERKLKKQGSFYELTLKHISYATIKKPLGSSHESELVLFKGMYNMLAKLKINITVVSSTCSVY